MGDSARIATRAAAMVARKEGPYRECNPRAVELAARRLPVFYGGVARFADLPP